MAKTYSPAEELLDGVLAQGVTPPLRAAGFRKTGRNYHRRKGGTVQVVNIQVSHGSTGMEKKFFVNAGVAFDAICELAGIPVLDKVKEYECDDRGTRSRLAEMMPGAPDVWTVQAGVDPSDVTAALLGFMQGLVAEFDVIDGPAAYRSHRWFDRFRPVPANAQIFYLIGDRTGARREVQDLAAFFADRKNANRVEWWVERLHLTGLGPAPQET
ncbi:DUF4304 domain-containing protein [Singulisphaera sp. Ch08]|uniref:DUF4304 domain-containing protein n=1 Tax=Singulisphaera sp. Ch08 TaxID=3120278 RepID=A0AAU7CJJ9_9BACT